MLRHELLTEIGYSLILAMIILGGMAIVEAVNWSEIFQAWQYNLDCDSGSGFYDAIVKP